MFHWQSLRKMHVDKYCRYERTRTSQGAKEYNSQAVPNNTRQANFQRAVLLRFYFIDEKWRVCALCLQVQQRSYQICHRDPIDIAHFNFQSHRICIPIYLNHSKIWLAWKKKLLRLHETSSLGNSTIKKRKTDHMCKIWICILGS